ncbi:nitroreductase family protein [Ilumatobacter coccineus]|uniref:Putative oxidoreductase n=1 Tax=Ilumatobacter coccineus (strain NBRC 103263 / KCTC 29153 / YM16-304) TaxID=1313172 RepID=A0A6C7EC54_ILUCY|nr:nitroreductase family protein [Ilumatobacter coccineus]BAN03582.1 putative oxidoreductase [Ilumatobacter coccineus YM16-304]
MTDNDPNSTPGTRHPRTGFDLAEADRLLKTTKQVRRRLDLSRAVPHDEILECIDVASHAPMGGNLERNRWMIIEDPATKQEIAERYVAVGAPYLDGHSQATQDQRAERVIESGKFLIEHLADVPALVLALRLDRPPPAEALGATAAYYGSVLPGVWSFQLAARARGLGSAWTTFHLEHEADVADVLGIPPTVTQVCLLPVAYYTGDTFSPAPRRPAREVTYLNRWKQPVEPPGDAT